ncbi:MAG: AAA family ATPase, partial [Clostridia bacterium]|nr:AAA family ATPase [Clostridia bacterium]
MKLTKLHIENYGRFCNYDYNFTDGLNEFCWQNGFGKTTLASFIKAMFYGLPSYRANSKDFNDRIHFYPFGGGKFGGNLTFVMDGREYRIERFFDKRSDSGDSLKVFCGGAPYSGFGKDIGKSVFGLDKASFERTVFIDSEAIDFGATGSISAKLNDCVDGGEGENTFADAVERLEQAKKALIPARGSNGKIPETRQDIAELNAKIANLKTISASLEGKYNELNSLNRQIRLAEERKAYEDRINLELSLWKTYDGHAEQAELRKAKLRRLCGEYPFGVPTERETDELKIISRELVKIKGAGSVTTWNDEKQARLDALKGKFASGVPSEETLELADRKTERLALMQSEVERSRGGDEKKLEEYGKKFASGVPDDKKLAECEKNFARLKEIDNQTGARMAAAVPEKKRGFKGLLAGVVAAVIAIIFGIVSLLLLDKVVGGVLAGVGAVLLAVCGILLFKTRPSGGVADEKLILLQSEKKAVTDQIYTVIAPLGYYSRNGVEYDYIAMKGDLSQYLALKDSAALSRAELESKKADILSLKSQLSAFFKQFGMEG